MIRESSTWLVLTVLLMVLTLTASALADDASPGAIAASPAAEPSSESSLSPAPNREDSENQIEETFLSLSAKRDDLERQIQETDDSLRNTLNPELYWLQLEETNRKLLGQLPATADSKEKEALNDEIAKDRKYAGTEESLADVQQKVNLAQNNEKQEKADKKRVESKISRMLDVEKPKQQFKLQMSEYFTILVGLIIIGFFIIAWLDEQVRREIFKGQAGIQFITLFALVIAIILFGITGILEGKELSALLGGLSGYILGRSTTTASGPAATTAQPQGGH
jgi:hypothetical protein